MTKRISTSRIIPSVGKKSRNVVTTEINVVKTSIRRLKPVWSAIAPKMGDKNAIMIASRILGYGKDYSFEYGGEEVTVDLTEIEPKFADESLKDYNGFLKRKRNNNL